MVERSLPLLNKNRQKPICSGQINQRLSSFFAERSFEDPHLVIDLEQVCQNYQQLNNVLPEATIFYAVKANPEIKVLKKLADLGSSFDAASISEIDLCLSIGVNTKNISFGNTIKKQRDIAKAFSKGIRIFAFDSEEELGKLAQSAPGSDVFCRVLVDCEGADWPLNSKFGCSVNMAKHLMLAAAKLGLIPAGISFHVGSQQTDINQWDYAIEQIKHLYSDLNSQGITLSSINLGGGFPTRYRSEIPDIKAYGTTLKAALKKHFGDNSPQVVIEPGRYIVGNAGVIEAEVILVSKKKFSDEKRWVYLDIGIFSGLAECLDEAIKYPITIVGKEDARERGPVVLAGPSCDSVDILYENANYLLPLDLKAGDKVHIHATGAYTATYSSVGFNGFPPLSCSCI